MSTEQLMKVATEGQWEGGVKTSISVRDFEPLIVDEPASLGGGDEGPNPVEYVLAGLSSCTSVMIALIAKEQDFTFNGVEFKNEGDIDIRGLQGVEGVSPHFQEVRFDVILDTTENEDKIQQLKEAVEKRCPVMNLLRDADIPVETKWLKKL
ncbi:OsmC family protein [Alteribacillus iranensis]|uniref:Uncharacterized OsmC-related protein n=1 Tax=Alteribacillus iranensis TaxID=930128 RepID=A0A1I2CPV5_9BACI|nr:OsmC family protein [Alteribacillus iranensis]SFE70288.1 Uncharacterized OsmC-related protein [Alteribacillus iranensis]